MQHRCSITSFLLSALLSVLMPFAALLDHGGLESSHPAGPATIGGQLTPSGTAVATPSAMRSFSNSDWIKQKPSTVLGGDTTAAIEAQVGRERAEIPVIARSEPGRFRRISDRSPPMSTTRA